MFDATVGERSVLLENGANTAADGSKLIIPTSKVGCGAEVAALLLVSSKPPTPSNVSNANGPRVRLGAATRAGAENPSSLSPTAAGGGSLFLLLSTKELTTSGGKRVTALVESSGLLVVMTKSSTILAFDGMESPATFRLEDVVLDELLLTLLLLLLLLEVSRVLSLASCCCCCCRILEVR